MKAVKTTNINSTTKIFISMTFNWNKRGDKSTIS